MVSSPYGMISELLQGPESPETDALYDRWRGWCTVETAASGVETTQNLHQDRRFKINTLLISRVRDSRGYYR